MSMSARLLLSPTALNYVPVLYLHLVSLGYLLQKRPKSRSTWLFCGWLGGMTLMTASQAVAGVLYDTPVSAYLGWWGGVTGVTLALIALLQFAYHFPRLRYAHEARVVLALSLLVTIVLLGWMAWETATGAAHALYATSGSDAQEALASGATWLSYDFERFISGFINPRDAGPLVSFKLFDLWQLVGNIWVLVVWLRKTLRFSKSSPSSPSGSSWRRAGEALRRPQGQEAQRARAWVLLMLLAPLPVLASSLEGTNMVPPGTFATVHLLVLFAIMLTYVNYAPEPTTFMVKLVGISLVTLLIILGLVFSYATRTYQEAYAQKRQAELAHLQTLIQEELLDDLPPDVLYVAARPEEGLFAPTYRMIAARPGAPDPAVLAAHDALLREGLRRRHYPTRYIVLHEHPWLGLEGVMALESAPHLVDELEIPEGAVSYRGSASPSAEHIVAYSTTQQGARYEVGYSYLHYREYLHQKILPLLILIIGSTLTILVLFPRFFHRGLIAPLAQLLEGVNRVNRGEMHVRVPVVMEDEIGHLTHAFNRMVESLSTSEEQLRTLNLTLEQQVAEQTRDLSTLYEVSAVASQSLNLNVLLEKSLSRTLDSLRSEMGAIYLLPEVTGETIEEDREQTLCLVIQRGLPPELLSTIQILGAAGGAVSWVMEHQQPLLIAGAKGPPSNRRLPPIPVLRNHSLLLAPLRAERHIVGLLILARPLEISFTVPEISLVASVADQIGVAVWSAHLRQETTLLEERQRIARDLHDAVTQSLYGVALLTEAGHVQLETLALPSESRTTLAQLLHTIGETARQAIKEMRLFIHELQPTILREQGLVGALHQRLAAVEGRASIEARLLADDTLRLPLPAERALYQIAQEALNNALRHAGASMVTLYWGREGEQAVLEIIDDGCGFDPDHLSNPGMGLENMRQRAAAIEATLKVISVPGGGTRVRVTAAVRADGDEE